MEEISSEKIAMKVSITTIAGNIFLSIFKLIAGVIGNSGAVLSDAIHSLTDVFSTIIVIIGVKLSNKKSDKSHPYGYERIECVAAIILSVILCITGIGIGYTGINKILDENSLEVPSAIALIAASISIVVKECMYWYTKKASKKINSGALMAEAWHHRADTLCSVGSFIGVYGAMNGVPVLDKIASVIICILIIKAAVTIFIDGINKMIDKSCDNKTIEDISSIVQSEEGVLGIDSIRTRLFGDKIYVDIEIQADGEDSLENTHKIAHNVHDKIEKEVPKVKHCMVHVNPTYVK